MLINIPFLRIFLFRNTNFDNPSYLLKIFMNIRVQLPWERSSTYETDILTIKNDTHSSNVTNTNATCLGQQSFIENTVRVYLLEGFMKPTCAFWFLIGPLDVTRKIRKYSGSSPEIETFLRIQFKNWIPEEFLML